MAITRRKCREVKVGNLTIGGEAPVLIQSMTSTVTSRVDLTLAQIEQLARVGCELVRVAVPDQGAVQALPELVLKSPVPLVADIHFDYRLALQALESGVPKVRINPGNIGGRDKFQEVIRRALSQGAALRLGVNAGSLDRPALAKYGAATPLALVESALNYLEIMKEEGFEKVVVSLKASDVLTTIEAYRLIAPLIPYPLHLGVTEAGPVDTGTIKSCLGIGPLLVEGIGDTLRVSLTADPVEEVRVARHILQALKLREFGPELISCPTCGRCTIDLLPLVRQVAELLEGIHTPLTVAVMGCPVNGPGEAREADLGVTASKQYGYIFRKGKIVTKVHRDDIVKALQEELNQLC